MRYNFAADSFYIISGERFLPLPIYWHHSKGSWLRYNFAADSFYIVKLCSRLFVLYCRNCLKDDKFRYLIPNLRNLGRRRTLVDGSLQSPCRVLVSVTELLFYLLRLRRYKAKCVKTRCLQVGVGHLKPTFQREGFVPLPIYWYHSKGSWMLYNIVADSFYIMKLCSRLFVLYCRNRKLGAAQNLGWWLVGKPVSSSC